MLKNCILTRLCASAPCGHNNMIAFQSKADHQRLPSMTETDMPSLQLQLESAILSVKPIFESPDLEGSLLTWWYIINIPMSNLDIKIRCYG